MNYNPYNPYDQNDQNQESTSSENQESFNNNPYAQNDNSQDNNQSYGNGYPNPLLFTKPPMNGLAIASMILGIVSLCCCCSSYTCGLLAIVFGIIAKCCGNKTGKSTAGIICGAISMGLTTLGFVFSLMMGMFEVPEGAEMALLISRMIF